MIEEEKPNNFELMKCVWMSSGLVNYKLCDFNFNCDECLFDKSMRNANTSISKEQGTIYEMIEGKIRSLKSVDYYNVHLQLDNNFILKKLYDSTYYLGLNRLAYTLLDNISGYEILPSETSLQLKTTQTGGKEKIAISKGKPLIKIQGDWGEHIVSSPVPFRSIEKIKKNFPDICNNTWIALVEAPENINDYVISREEYNRKINSIEKVLADCLVETTNVGITLNDGGKPVRYLYELVGRKKYQEILNNFF